MKLIPAAERPKRSQSPCPTNRNQHRQTVLLVEFNSALSPPITTDPGHIIEPKTVLTPKT